MLGHIHQRHQLKEQLATCPEEKVYSNRYDAFNGAAADQPRKMGMTLKGPSFQWSFNGAAADQPRKAWVDLHGTSRSNGLQWGRG